MTSFTGTADGGAEVIYTDHKRHMYWLILISPAVSLLSIWLYFDCGLPVFCHLCRYARPAVVVHPHFDFRCWQQ